MSEAKRTKSKAKLREQSKEAELLIEAELVSEEASSTATAEATYPKAKTTTAKAGKRSAKAVAEEEIKDAKQAKKTDATTTKETSKIQKKPTRSKIDRSGKKYREVAKLLEKDKTYSLEQALDLALKTSTTNFDSTVELHINLGVDPRQADQNIRDTVLLPGGTGKSVRIAVLGDDEESKTAKAAGADIAGADTLLSKLDKEEIEFDVLIATPAQMSKLGKYARLLGPRGLMPNPKSGTVTTDIKKAVAEAKAGKVEYRVDQAGIVHLGIGKVSFGQLKIKQNADAVIASIKAAKPSSLKGNYIKSSYVTTSMGPGIKFELN